jgi:universal stress protein E
MNGIVHVFHAFNPYINPDDPNIIEEAHESALNELAGKFEIPEDRVHLRAGDTADLLPHLVREYAADLVIMGAVSRSRLEQAIIGSTAENSLDRLPCDVLVIKPKGFISPVTFKAAPPGAIIAD